MSEQRIARLTVAGRVQGVGFRAFVEDEALARNLEGWVRNRRDGSVEAVIAGPPEVVADMIEACRSGPRLARVVSLRVEETSAAALRPGAGRFIVLPTT